MLQFTCKKCGEQAECDYDDENEGTNLCYDCFEEALQNYEERRLERIARDNEY